jgi:hypothetical protein
MHALIQRPAGIAGAGTAARRTGEQGRPGHGGTQLSLSLSLSLSSPAIAGVVFGFDPQPYRQPLGRHAGCVWRRQVIGSDQYYDMPTEQGGAVP